MLLRSQSVEPPPVLKVCRSWGEMVTDDSDWPPEKMLYSSLIGKDWRVEQIQRDSQSESVDFPDCLSHYRLLTTSPWLSLAVSFSHIFQRLPWEKKGCWAVQTVLSFKICPCAISLSSPSPRLWKTFSVFPCPLCSRQTAPHSFSSHCQVVSERRRIETALKHTVRYISSFVFHATLRCCCFM